MTGRLPTSSATRAPLKNARCSSIRADRRATISVQSPASGLMVSNNPSRMPLIAIASSAIAFCSHCVLVPMIGFSALFRWFYLKECRFVARPPIIAAGKLLQDGSLDQPRHRKLLGGQAPRADQASDGLRMDSESFRRIGHRYIIIKLGHRVLASIVAQTQQL